MLPDVSGGRPLVTIMAEQLLDELALSCIGLHELRRKNEPLDIH